jgi:glyoxylase-like metal-dependent hydrolase (beta-lactamase superfamily II)
VNRFFLAIIIAAIILQGCTFFEIGRSPKRDSPPQSLELSNGVTITSTGAVNVYVFILVNHKDLFPASFRIDAPGVVACIDPVVLDDPKPADFIFITHSHGDHFSLNDIAKIATEKP